VSAVVGWNQNSVSAAGQSSKFKIAYRIGKDFSGDAPTADFQSHTHALFRQVPRRQKDFSAHDVSCHPRAATGIVVARICLLSQCRQARHQDKKQTGLQP
jgi:hypothetical protein